MAVIGALGVVLSAALSAGSVHLRRLQRIRNEADLYAALPADMEAERRLAKMLLNQSLWEYALARRRLAHPVPYLLLGLMASAVIGVGWQLVIRGGVEDLVPNWPEDPNYRLVGLSLVVLGALLYVRTLKIPIVAAQRRVRALEFSPSRMRQLIALEAERIDAGYWPTDLAYQPSEEPKRHDVLARFGNNLLVRKWAGLEECLPRDKTKPSGVAPGAGTSSDAASGGGKGGKASGADVSPQS